MHAHFDCFCGISGDMALGAFIDLGVPASWLTEQIERLPLDGFRIDVSSVTRSGITAKQVRVMVDEHVHARSWADIRTMIQDSRLPQRAAATSLAIFQKIAAAEARIHGCSEEAVHFHEIGGIDSIVDIVGTALCMERLGIESVTASRIPLGSGTVRCDHGTLPVPVPATLAILKGIPVYGTGIQGELVTPTGAAIIATLADAFQPMPDWTLTGVGYGAGSREYPSMPNLLRIVTGEPEAAMLSVERDRVTVIETAIDDMNPEIFGYLMERLFDDGALDVCWIPVHMKKNRPGTLLQVISPVDKEVNVIRRILSETTALGVRHRTVGRTKLTREPVDVETSLGRIAMKKIHGPDGGVRLVPEYEICKKIAAEKKMAIRDVYERLVRETAQSA